MSHKSVTCGWRAVLVLGLLTLSACASGSRVQALDDGAYRIECSGGYHDWSGCLNAARSTCGARGFVEESRVSNEGADVGTHDWSTEGSIVTRVMVFRCAQ
ncbi:MAG: hypothetical protein R3E86_16320 [Pseudomonadales bacterium]